MKYSYWLASLPISSSKKIRLCWDFISALSVYEAKEKDLKRLDYLNENDVKRITDNRKKTDALDEYETLAENGIHFCSILQKEYPARLKNIYDPPFGIFYKGRLPVDDGLKVAIVGARVCSAYGQKISQNLGEAFGKLGIDVISGMAKGVDSAAHQGTLLSGGSTFAVLGCGADVCYPSQNRELYKNIITNGGVISEYAPGTNAMPEFFPQRNRIISGLADIVIITEAKKKSGSLITGDIAIEQGKEVYCVPGRMGDELSFGTNNLIHQGAGIITSIEQLMEDLNLTYKSKRKRNSIPKGLTKEEVAFYRCLEDYPKDLNAILDESGLTLMSIFSAVSSLEEKGLIKETFKNNYIRC